MSNDISCVNHDRRKFKVFSDPFIDADINGSLHMPQSGVYGWKVFFYMFYDEDSFQSIDTFGFLYERDFPGKIKHSTNLYTRINEISIEFLKRNFIKTKMIPLTCF